MNEQDFAAETDAIVAGRVGADRWTDSEREQVSEILTGEPELLVDVTSPADAADVIVALLDELESESETEVVDKPGLLRRFWRWLLCLARPRRTPRASAGS